MARSSISRNAETAERMRRRIAFTGVTPNGHPIWDGQETGDLVEGHPDYDAVMQKMWRRTRLATRGKACRLKITKRRPPRWTINEILRLRRIYPTSSREEVLAQFPGRTYEAVAKAATSRGIYRASRPIRPTGSAVLDAILARARDRNWSMTELDEAVNGKGYFARRQWRRGRFNNQLHGKVLEHLGGQFRIRWLDVKVAA